MSQPQLTINVQLNIYSDGRVEVVPTAPTSTPTSKSAAAKVASPATNSLPSAPPSSETKPPDTSGASPAAGPPSTPSEPSGPSDADLRAALLRVAKATNKVKAVEVLKEIAGVERLPEVAAEHRAAIIERWEAMIVEANKAPAEGEETTAP